MNNTEMDEKGRNVVEDMLSFWAVEATDRKFATALPDKLKCDTSNPIAGMFGRMSGVFLDFEKLIKLGIPGIKNEILKYQKIAASNGKDVKLYEGMKMALDSLVDICLYYEAQIIEVSSTTDDLAWRQELSEMSFILNKLTVSKPQTFREAVQLSWLYALVSGVVNYGRMDVYLGDFYARDIDSGCMTEEYGLKLIQSLWQLIADRRIAFNSRVIIGGRGRPNEVNADRFALAAMEATRTVKETEPQLSLRFYKGMNGKLMEKALDVIGEGRLYPMLYNDDVNIHSVQRAFNVSYDEAEHYLPYGCGEYALDHRSFGSPNSSLNLMKALEAALHNGFDALTGEILGPQTGEFINFQTFEELLTAYKRQVEYFVSALAARDAIENRVKDHSAAFLYASMLFDNCLEKGKSIVGGGAKYLGALIESFGMVNVADSLTSIKELVYDKKQMTQEKMLEVLDANFESYKIEHKMMLETPKYGNDKETADQMLQEISHHICEFTRGQAKKIGFDYYLIVNINNFGNVTYGKRTAASADGRKVGEPLANGNTPTAGMDKEGITAFLNSISKVDASEHAGYVHNMKFTRTMFTAERKKLEALLTTYFDKGGTQAMITVVNRGDLENALKEPQKYRNLMVRVGGFSARFVELSRDIQEDVLKRTLY